jgi:hypothetical protein
MDNVTQERFDRLTALAAEDPNSLTTADVEFLRARSEYLTEEQHRLIDPLFRTAGEGNLIAQAVTPYDKHIKGTNLSHPVDEAQRLAATEEEKEIMSRETEEQIIKRAHEAGVQNPERFETRPELIEAIVAAQNPLPAEPQRVDEEPEKAPKKAAAKKAGK